MNISRKPNEESEAYENWEKLREIKFMLAYHLHWDLITINNFIQTFSGNKNNLKNYWLQKKEVKEQAKAHNAKLDEIARFVTKYINNRKSSKG